MTKSYNKVFFLKKLTLGVPQKFPPISVFYRGKFSSEVLFTFRLPTLSLLYHGPQVSGCVELPILDPRHMQ